MLDFETLQKLVDDLSRHEIPEEFTVVVSPDTYRALTGKSMVASRLLEDMPDTYSLYEPFMNVVINPSTPKETQMKTSTKVENFAKQQRDMYNRQIDILLVDRDTYDELGTEGLPISFLLVNQKPKPAITIPTVHGDTLVIGMDWPKMIHTHATGWVSYDWASWKVNQGSDHSVTGAPRVTINCECGAEKVNSLNHSNWCPKHV